jgi:PAS domain S-box-containing protein
LPVIVTGIRFLSIDKSNLPLSFFLFFYYNHFMRQIHQYIPVLYRFVKSKSNKKVNLLRNSHLLFGRSNRLHLLLNKLDALVVIIDGNGSVQYVSNSSKKILGYNPEELLDNQWWLLTRKNEAERNTVRDLVLKFQKGQVDIQELRQERMLTTASGQVKWLTWNISLLPDNSIIAIGNDVTKRKLYEQHLHKAHQDLLEKNKEIISSIEYAERLQQAILPNVFELKNSFKGNAFVLYKPKDMVSGDFYWHYKIGNKIYIAAIDCTGHGVPGALMSLIAHSIFKEVFITMQLNNPAEILYALDTELFNELNKNKQHTPYPDGMDVALCCLDLNTNQLEFAGAMRPLLIVRNKEIIEIKPSRFPIGFYKDISKQFVTEKIALQPNDAFYIFSDGYIDQFGGDTSVHKDGKKLNKARFKELLLTINEMEIEEQETFLEYALSNWKQQIEQTDDILVIGVKV